jgi:hypothetical protein
VPCKRCFEQQTKAAKTAINNKFTRKHEQVRHNVLTTSLTAHEHAAAPIAAGCSHHFPASKARAESPGSQKNPAIFAGRANPRMDLRDVQRPKPHSQSTRTQHNTTHAASMGRAEAPSKRRRTLGSWSATPFQRSRRFRQSAQDAHGISHGNVRLP